MIAYREEVGWMRNSSRIREIVRPARLLVPDPGMVNQDTWAVIACDQHTSATSPYWRDVSDIVGDNPSTLRLIVPEHYMAHGTSTVEQMVRQASIKMREYIDTGILVERRKPSFVYALRTFYDGSTRRGLVAMLDLEEYDYHGRKTLIRPTEKTIEDRLDIRVRLRMGAALETPHIMMLIDDPHDSVIGAISKRGLSRIFAADLMLGGGRIEAYAIDDPMTESEVYKALEGLFDRMEGNLFIASGDGNHSMAAAKKTWEIIKNDLLKSGIAWQDHPARYALAEIVNIYDKGLTFEPIHRIVSGISDEARYISVLQATYGADFDYIPCPDYSGMSREMARLVGRMSERHIIGTYGTSMAGDSKEYAVLVLPKCSPLPVGTLHMALDTRDEKVDYAHEEKTVIDEASSEGRRGFFMLPMDRRDLFPIVRDYGVTPPKTFSLGFAHAKNYYYLARRLDPWIEKK